MANTPGNEPSLEAAGAAVLHAPPTSTYQAWSRSFVEMYTIAHEWTIENFIELDEEASVCFKVLIFKPYSNHYTHSFFYKGCWIFLTSRIPYFFGNLTSLINLTY